MYDSFRVLSNAMNEVKDIYFNFEWDNEYNLKSPFYEKDLKKFIIDYVRAYKLK